MTMPAAPPPSKKKGPLFWVLLGIGVFVLLLMVGLGALGYYGFQKAKEAGLDPEMAKTNPNFFAVKTTVVLNSDSEIVEEDPEGARIHVRSKRTGEESIVSVNKDKQIVNSRYDPSVPFLPKPAEQTKEEEKK